jgi:hypothetical protein
VFREKKTPRRDLSDGAWLMQSAGCFNWLVLCARCHVKQLDEKLNRPSVTDLSAPTPFRPPRPRRRVKPKPKERWRYPEGLALKHARLLIERGYPLEDVAETIGSRPDDLRRVLEIGHRD